MHRMVLYAEDEQSYSFQGNCVANEAQLYPHYYYDYSMTAVLEYI